MSGCVCGRVVRSDTQRMCRPSQQCALGGPWASRWRGSLHQKCATNQPLFRIRGLPCIVPTQFRCRQNLRCWCETKDR
jgi:hypothetical protein